MEIQEIKQHLPINTVLKHYHLQYNVKFNHNDHSTYKVYSKSYHSKMDVNRHSINSHHNSYS